jgi:hypothetical protein
MKRTLTAYLPGEMGRRSQYDTQGADEAREEEEWLAENPQVAAERLVREMCSVVRVRPVDLDDEDDDLLPGERRRN